MSVRGRLWLVIAITVAVAAILSAAGLAWWRWDTARQPKVTADIPFMDQAVADTLTAAGPDAAVAASGVYRAATCRLGALRTGGEYTRKADLYTDPGGEETLLARIERGLPAAYAARRLPAAGSGAAPVEGATGSVRLSVRQLGAGWLVATARTGCTTGTDPAVPSDPGDAATAAAIGDLLGRLNTSPAETLRHVLPCPAGQLVTVAVLSRPADAADVAGRLAAVVPATARRFDSPANRLSWRDGPTSVIVSASDDNTAITVRHTTSC